MTDTHVDAASLDPLFGAIVHAVMHHTGHHADAFTYRAIINTQYHDDVGCRVVVLEMRDADGATASIRAVLDRADIITALELHDGALTTIDPTPWAMMQHTVNHINGVIASMPDPCGDVAPVRVSDYRVHVAVDHAATSHHRIVSLAVDDGSGVFEFHVSAVIVSGAIRSLFMVDDDEHATHIIG